MRVLLIQSHLGRRSSPVIFPIGLCYVATALTRQTVKILDLNLWDLSHSCKMLEQCLLEFKPDIVGVSIRNIDTCIRTDVFLHFQTIIPTIQLIKKTDHKIRILAGGPGFTMFAQDIMERIPEIDFGIYMEADESVSDLIENLDSPENVKGVFFRKDKSIHFTGLRNLPDFENLPMPGRDADLIDIKPYIAADSGSIGIQTKRGCVLKCTYCNYPFLSGNQLRLRPPKNVVDEIEYLMGLGVKSFSFVDNIFNVPLSHSMEICREIVRRDLDVKWCAWYEIKNATEELLSLAKKAGCYQMEFSPDAATNRGLSSLNKGISVKDIKKVQKIIRGMSGIKAKYNFFFSLPGIGLQDKIKTLAAFFGLLVRLFSGKGGGGGRIGWIRIEKDTRIYKSALEEGVLTEKIDLMPNSKKDLLKLFYFNKPYKYLDYFVLYFMKITEQIIKPAGKFLQSLLRS